MKLRNKKTGEVTEGVVWLETRFHKEPWHCESISDLVEHWEDYKPAEPLIKDEEIRKTIKAWARVNDAKEVVFDEYWHSFRSGDIAIGFCFSFTDFDWLEDNKTYTIDELCGEEE